MSRRYVRRRAVWVSILLLPAMLQAFSASADWPGCRYDNRRAAVTDEKLAAPLAIAWTHRAGEPRPAWSESPAKRDVYRKVYGLSPTVIFDRAYHPIVADGRLYYGSSADDSVYCLDASSGDVRWSFTTEGPVRLAPAVADGRVFFGSDDGCVYCLDATDGRLVWKHRSGSSDRRLPGNGRVMSLWPIRCGVAVDEGVVYFTAGLLPSQGAYLCAVNATDGSQVWRQDIDLSPQGYLMVSSSRLFVPTGRTPPHIFDKASGSQLVPFSGAGQQRSGTPEGGGCWGLVLDDTLVHAAGERGGLQMTSVATREKLISTSGVRMVAQGEMAYIATMDRLSALNRADYVKLSQLRQKKTKTADDEKRITELAGSYLRWEVPCEAPLELIMAGHTLLLGAEGKVVAIDAADGQTVWSGPVDGKAYALAVSDERLYVGTDSGAIHCFGRVTEETVSRSERQGASRRPVQNGPSTRSHQPAASAVPLTSSSSARDVLAAEAAVAAADTDQGYCLVLSAGDGRLAYEIAKRSKFRVIGVEADAEKVALARQKLTAAGLYGSRVVMHHGALESLRYQKRFANLIVYDMTETDGQPTEAAEEVYRLLRPSGGAAVMVGPNSDETAQSLEKWMSQLTALPGPIPEWNFRRDSQSQLIVASLVRDPLEGAGEWTHFHADAGNSACSGDQLAFGPVDVQWFGRPGPRRMVDRHEKNVAPLYKDGRMFVSGDNYIVAVDAYNGTVLWEHDLPDSIRLGAFKNCGSMAVTDDYLYVAAAGQCIGLDVRTGERTLTFDMPGVPSDGQQEWGYVAVVGNTLFGSATKPGATFRVQDIDTQDLIWRDNRPVVTSDGLFALDRHSGKPLWGIAPAKGVIVNPTIAVDDDRIYFIHAANPAADDAVDGRVTLDTLFDGEVSLVALNATTGWDYWSQPIDLGELEHIVFLSLADDTLVITGSKNVSVPGETKKRVRYDFWAFNASNGKPLWRSTQTPTPDHILEGPHGEQVQHSAIVDGVIYNTGIALDLRSGEPVDGWRWQKSDKCGTVSASASCLFSRYSNPRMFDTADGEYVSLTDVTRPGCWINILPAGGLVLIPEASSGCTCYYSVQTSVALSPRDEAP